MENILQQLEKRREEARLGGGKKRVEAQHEKGKLTARERLEAVSYTHLTLPTNSRV